MAIEVHFEKHIMNSKVIRETDTKSHRDYIIVTALATMFLLACLVTISTAGCLLVPVPVGPAHGYHHRW